MRAIETKAQYFEHKILFAMAENNFGNLRKKSERFSFFRKFSKNKIFEKPNILIFQISGK